MLPSINILPWREQRREAHRQRFFQSVVLSLVVAFGLQFALGRYAEQQQRQQQTRLDYLNQQIVKVDKRIAAMKVSEKEHQALLTRLEVVETLQRQRNKTTDFMNLMPTLIPEGVYVDKIKMNGVLVEVTGISDSTARLATMLDSLEKSPQLNNVEMHSIVHDKPRFGKKYQTFKVSFELAQDADTASVLPRFHAEEVRRYG
ncbi:pilus assembly protein PilN [Vibrio astriarenae]|uniref:Pilus assembly protein PilN n=1 Tax=Vibrio astriarenae TaxID=1481923 RepID=A0A7Z2T4S3_9VIBR|nr:PilN domain-containing protein [Vibrio astriarenae]QIA64408.1 pilus assembly protein PilN [Vibrio astriarenae]